MGVFAMTALYVNLSSNDLTDHIKQANLELEIDAQDSTAMGDSWKEFIAGLKSGKLTIEVEDDYASSSIDSIVWSAFNTGTAITFEIRPTNSAVSTTNPKYTGSVLPVQYAIGGQLGELAMKKLTYPTTGAVSRATS